MERLAEEIRQKGGQALVYPVDMTNVQAATFLLRGIKRQQHEVMAPVMLRIVVGLNYLFPSITRWLMTATGYRRPGQRMVVAE